MCVTGQAGLVTTINTNNTITVLLLYASGNWILLTIQHTLVGCRICNIQTAVLQNSIMVG